MTVPARRRRAERIVTSLAAVVAAIFFWAAAPPPLPAARPPVPAPATSPPPRAVPAAIPGLTVAGVTKAWAARWKAKPAEATWGDRRVVTLTVPFPGHPRRTLALVLYRLPGDPAGVWMLSCGRDEWQPESDGVTDPAAMIDYCLHGVVSTTSYREITAWAKQVRPYDGTGQQALDRHQFAGYTFQSVGGGLAVDVTGGTGYPV
ncbi:hypothetical protein GCM10010168_68710 [Actinoplanes ianthinogenes]|uniref:Uncharacterized protein n=1 Tax=Actinoplanes ianthinogenes TaxID=122358 RepID=A0ABM7M0E1_9ACTN|nr:hypothetical protein [Actinoplanes ianthinogenes]BCJ45071.1 hypothetical protein Aiant_57280 [Actinoplanes ianthinogenes]GGR40377.1 hypothetical protein GCM10010168_68710 [Actinoplanes ianthinogenes]